MKAIGTYFLGLVMILAIPTVLALIGMAVSPNFLSHFSNFINTGFNLILNTGFGLTFLLLMIFLLVPSIVKIMLYNSEKSKSK